MMFTYPVHQAADILFCRARPRARRPRPAAARRARPACRRGGSTPATPHPATALPRARGAARIGAAPARRRRWQDEQEPRKRDRDRRERRRDGPPDPHGRHRFRAHDHLRARPAAGGSNLVLLAALCRDEPPEAVAEAIGAGGATALKRVAIDAVNDRFRGRARTPARADRRPRLPARRVALRQRAGAGDRRRPRSRRCTRSCTRPTDRAYAARPSPCSIRLTRTSVGTRPHGSRRRTPHPPRGGGRWCCTSSVTHASPGA